MEPNKKWNSYLYNLFIYRYSFYKIVTLRIPFDITSLMHGRPDQAMIIFSLEVNYILLGLMTDVALRKLRFSSFSAASARAALSILSAASDTADR